MDVDKRHATNTKENIVAGWLSKKQGMPSALQR